MSIRATCLRKGHKVDHQWVPLAYEFCSRWFCDWSRASKTYPVPEPLRRELQRTSDLENAAQMERVVNWFGMRVRT